MHQRPVSYRLFVSLLCVVVCPISCVSFSFPVLLDRHAPLVNAQVRETGTPLLGTSFIVIAATDSKWLMMEAESRPVVKASSEPLVGLERSENGRRAS